MTTLRQGSGQVKKGQGAGGARQGATEERSANYRWTDAVLNRHIDRAVRELSAVWPRERKTTAQTAAGSREVSVPLDQLVRIEAVESPTGEWPPAFVQWQLYGSVLTLLLESAPAAVADVNVYWGQLHAVDATQSTLPTAAEDAGVTGARGAAGRGGATARGARRSCGVFRSCWTASAMGRGWGWRRCSGRMGRRAATWCSGSREAPPRRIPPRANGQTGNLANGPFDGAQDRQTGKRAKTMKQLSSTLLAAQKGASGAPYVKAELSDYYGDRSRIRFTRHYTGSEPEGRGAVAGAGDGSLVRARVDPSTEVLYTQRVTTPGPGDDFSQWTSHGAIGTQNGVALAGGAGATVYLFYVAGGGGNPPRE